MNINIRNHIINNFRGDNIETIKMAIEESIKDQDEIALPGMGVFLEIIWENADDDLKRKMLSIIKNSL